MSKINRVRSQAGFSLIELMIVVAIIGVLAAIAVPNFQKFQAKSKQSEVKGNLTGIFTGEKAFLGEWNMYTGDLRDIGFAPEGNIRYHVGFAGVGTVPPAPFNPSIAGTAAGACFNTSVAACNVAAALGTYTIDAATPAYAAAAAAGTCPAGADPAGGVGARTFVATGIGSIGTTVNDIWTMTQGKSLCNNVSGI